MRLRVAGLALCIAGLALSGCGTGADQRAVRATTERFYAAVHDHDGRTACALLDSDTARSSSRTSRSPTAPRRC